MLPRGGRRPRREPPGLAHGLPGLAEGGRGRRMDSVHSDCCGRAVYPHLEGAVASRELDERRGPDHVQGEDGRPVHGPLGDLHLLRLDPPDLLAVGGQPPHARRDALPRVRHRRLVHALHDAHGPRHPVRRRADRRVPFGALLPARARAVRAGVRARHDRRRAPPAEDQGLRGVSARASASETSSAPLSGRRPAQRANFPRDARAQRCVPPPA
mmetsp:Transcript_14098/g.41541  ORF Transcript_14098/g.41541 Transcript_14098/m.41541 type:complete len:213 (+) Transcript_14098:2041-2679(+)